MNSGLVTFLVYDSLKSEPLPTFVLRVRISEVVNNLGTASLRTFAEGLTSVGPPDYVLESRNEELHFNTVRSSLGLLCACVVVISLLYGSFAPKL